MKFMWRKKLQVILLECTKRIKSYFLELEKKMILKKIAFTYDLFFSKQIKERICYYLIHEECDDGTFGTNCSSACGHCHQGQACDKKTGSCPKECDSGYEGIYCNKCKIYIDLNSSFVPYRFKRIIISMIFNHIFVCQFTWSLFIETISGSEFEWKLEINNIKTVRNVLISLYFFKFCFR